MGETNRSLFLTSVLCLLSSAFCPLSSALSPQSSVLEPWSHTGDNGYRTYTALPCDPLPDQTVTSWARHREKFTLGGKYFRPGVFDAGVDFLLKRF